jgi:hypothetical protein
LHLRAEDIGSVVWCTGLTGDFTWVDPALLDGERMLCRRYRWSRSPRSGRGR